MPAASAKSVRRQRAEETFTTAAECIGTVEPGMALFALTRGQFSMIDAILACLDQVGPAAISLWTWRVADYEIECIERLMADRRVTGARLIIDTGARERDMALLQKWHGLFGAGSIRLVRNHAKIATVEGGGFKLLLRGSMNLNFNPRFEQFDVTEGGADFDMIREVEDGLDVLPLHCSAADAAANSGLSKAWSDDQLTMFTGASPWRK